MGLKEARANFDKGREREMRMSYPEPRRLILLWEKKKRRKLKSLGERERER